MCLEQTKRVRNSRARSTETRGDGFLGHAELVDELAERVCLFDCVEIRALQVLHQGKLELIAIGQVTDDSRDPLQAGKLCGPDSPLASDQLIAVQGLGDEHGLKHPVLADADGKLFDRFLADPAPGLVRVARDARNRDV